MSTNSLIGEVREIAERLAAALRDGAPQTDDWQDDARSWPIVQGAMDRCLTSLDALGCRGEANRLPSGELWKIAGEWLETGWLQNHARTKPRGYAGDFEMFAAICDERICEHALGKHFDRYFQNQAAARAVRNRTELVARAIVAAASCNGRDRFRIVSVGSGPAIDLRRAVERLEVDRRKKLNLSLFDLDPAALDFASRLLAEAIDPQQFECCRANLYRLPRQSDIDELLDAPQFLFCIGLFDYLNNDDASAMLATFWKHLAPAGEMLVFNFSTDNPSRAYMEWIGNWYLVERDANQMAALAERAAIPRDAVEIGVEEVGVNLFLRAVKPPR